MKITYHTLKGKYLQKGPAPQSTTEQSFVWQEVSECAPEDLPQLIAENKWGSLIEENLYDTSRHTRATLYDDILYVEFPGIYIDQGPHYPDVIAIISKGQVTTLHKGPPLPFEGIIESFAARRGRVSSELTLLYLILESYVQFGLSKALSLRKSIHELGRQRDLTPRQVDFKQLMPIKKAVGDLIMISEEQNYALRVLKNISSLHFDFNKAEIYFTELLQDVRQILSTTTRQEDRLEELHTHHVLFLQDQTNKKLGTLTIISAIFQPMALIAGIYGMNFVHMPELQWTYGYPLIMLLMFSIAASMLFVFWRRGWFR